MVDASTVSPIDSREIGVEACQEAASIFWMRRARDRSREPRAAP